MALSDADAEHGTPGRVAARVRAEHASDAPSSRYSGLRILEIGDRELFAQGMPANTLLLWTGIRPIRPGVGRVNFALGEIPRLAGALQRADYDLIVCHAPNYHPLGWRWLARMLGRYGPFFPRAVLRGCGCLMLRLPTRAPVVVIDSEDHAAINRHNLPLMAKCRAFFKRELPADPWKVFFKTAHPNLPTARFRRLAAYRRCIDKLHPISLGISAAKLRQIPNLPVDKTADVFFAGSVRDSPLRARGLEQLSALRREGYAIDIAEPDLPPADYFARMAHARLTWSPEGYGWDCFRHYEAAACGSVPVVNIPSIYRHQPLLDGVHCFYYDPEGDGLKAAIVRALRDRRRLAEMGAAARAHVLRHHTQRSLCEYVLETALGAEAAETSGQAAPGPA